MIMSEWTWRVSIIYRWCARWIGNKVPRKLPPLSNQASSRIMEQVQPRRKLCLSLSPSFFSSSLWVGAGYFRCGMMTLSKWHWLKGKKCASERRFKTPPLHHCSVLYCALCHQTMIQWQPSIKCAEPAPDVHLGSERVWDRHIDTPRKRERDR